MNGRWVSYVAILALQLAVIWGVWSRKDLTSGDTSGYFTMAMSWIHGLHDNIEWSPLYQVFLGTITALVHPVGAALMLHRVLIVLATALVVLAIARVFMPAGIALLVAAWWTLLPASFNLMYEVHLFGLGVAGLAVVVGGRNPGRRRVGAALAIVLAAGLLIRNELVLAAVIVAAVVVVYELRLRRRGQPASRRILLRAYVLPVVVASLLFAGAWERSFVPLGPAVQSRAALTVCQMYAFNFMQRHPSQFTGNPFTQCEPLIKQTFGEADPTLGAAALANPRAFTAFVGYNVGVLLPFGLQVALFGATTGAVSPDYVPVHTNAWYPSVLSAVFIAILIAGLLCARQDRDYWRRWLVERRWAVVVLTALAAAALFVATFERPQPEFIYELPLTCMMAAGVALSAILRRLKVQGVVLSTVAAVTVVALLIAWPSYYGAAPRPLYDALHNLESTTGPAHELTNPGSVLVTDLYGTDLCNYLSYSASDTCTAPSWPAINAELVGGAQLSAVLARLHATAVYVDVGVASTPGVSKLVASPEQFGWREVKSGSDEEGRWEVLTRARI